MRFHISKIQQSKSIPKLDDKNKAEFSKFNKFLISVSECIATEYTANPNHN